MEDQFNEGLSGRRLLHRLDWLFLTFEIIQIDLRAPDASTTAYVSLTVTTIIDYQKLILALVGVLKIIKLCLKSTSRI